MLRVAALRVHPAPVSYTHLRQNLEKWNQLTPEQRNDIRIRGEIFDRMTPEQKQYVRDNLLPRWQALPPERRLLILGRQRVLNNMPPAQREARLNDPEFMRGLSPDEQQTLRDLNTVSYTHLDVYKRQHLGSRLLCS